MFLNLGKFTRLMKQAYKRSLRIGNLGGKIFIASGYWAVAIDNEMVPNKIKAMIVELAGELPAPGILFEVNKSLQSPQILIDKNSLINVVENVDIATNKMIITPLSVNNQIKLLQTQISGFNEMHGISEEYLEMIDKTEIDYDIEGEPTGPCCMSSSPGGIFWSNSTGVVVIYPIRLKETPMIEALARVDFSKKEDC